jgi:hypothetical protein
LAYQPLAQQYFSLGTNQPPAISQQYFSLGTNQHQQIARNWNQSKKRLRKKETKSV